MDRNVIRITTIDCISVVALRKESVDRNYVGVTVLGIQHVALRKESVDRNLKRSKTMKNRRKSLSARRAWIEISTKLRVFQVD